MERAKLLRHMTAGAAIAVWTISAATIAAILLRPWRIGEWVWATAGAAVLVASGLLGGTDAANAALDGLDVYLFLAGMLTLAELARIHGVFDRAAQVLLRSAAGSSARLFAWVYAGGIAVTALLSNDGTILLLTPAVLALSRCAGVAPLPFLYACAFVANAASFILPISNPANLVVFRRLPTLLPWLGAFWLPSTAAVGSTFLLLRYAYRRELGGRCNPQSSPFPLTQAGKTALCVVSASAVLIVAATAFGWPVGRVTFVLAALSMLAVTMRDSTTPAAIARQGPWSIVPLVAGLFVIVQGLDRTGVLEYARAFFHQANGLPQLAGSLLTGSVVAIADNVLNNLPTGVLVRYALHDHQVGSHIANAALIGVDLGPNLSVTGSLATLLWLLLLRRDGVEVTPRQFLRIGLLVTVPALALSLVCLR